MGIGKEFFSIEIQISEKTTTRLTMRSDHLKRKNYLGEVKQLIEKSAL